MTVNLLNECNSYLDGEIIATDVQELRALRIFRLIEPDMFEMGKPDVNAGKTNKISNCRQ